MKPKKKKFPDVLHTKIGSHYNVRFPLQNSHWPLSSPLIATDNPTAHRYPRRTAGTHIGTTTCSWSARGDISAGRRLHQDGGVFDPRSKSRLRAWLCYKAFTAVVWVEAQSPAQTEPCGSWARMYTACSVVLVRFIFMNSAL